MLRWGLPILGVGFVLLLIFDGSGGFGICGPRPGMLPVFLACMLTLPVGGLMTLIGLGGIAINRFRHRKENAAMPRITPL